MFPRILSHDVWRLEGWQGRLRQPSKTAGIHVYRAKKQRLAWELQEAVRKLGMTFGDSIDRKCSICDAGWA